MHRLPQELVAEINGLEALDARALHWHCRSATVEVRCQHRDARKEEVHCLVRFYNNILGIK